MRFGQLRRMFMLFVLGAFLCANLGQRVPNADATPTVGAPGMSVAMDMGDSGSLPMPCKGNLPNCYTSIGCIFLVAHPPSYTPTAIQLVWSRVVYASVASWQAGLSLEPDLGPPIHA